MSTLGDLLPADQAGLVSASVQSMGRQDIENAIHSGSDHGLASDDVQGLKKLAVTRINQGQTPFTYDSHNFKVPETEQDPNTCFCV